MWDRQNPTSEGGEMGINSTRINVLAISTFKSVIVIPKSIRKTNGDGIINALDIYCVRCAAVTSANSKPPGKSILEKLLKKKGFKDHLNKRNLKFTI